MIGRFKNFFINLIFPALIFGSITGILTGAIISLYKFCAKHVISFSEKGYHFLNHHLYVVPLVLVGLLLLAVFFSYVYKKIPRLKGGGIPSSIAILRGLITFKWLRVLIGVFFMSLASFLVGVPLGNEGPSVLIGTAVGKGSAYTLAHKHRAWAKYSITGGACAGFSVATGAPISGIVFALEEAHHHVSPMILIVSCFSVLFARIATELLAPLLGVSISLFPELSLVSLGIKDLWMPLLIGIIMGFFAVLFLNLYKLINRVFNKRLKKINLGYKIFFVFALTLLLGIISYSYISTGHELILHLIDFTSRPAILTLLLILLVRSILTLCANTNKITGGIFLPILALGTLLASATALSLEKVFGLSHEYYTLFIALGLASCISGMMKMPLTAIIFSVEALSCYNNILYVIIASASAFVITEIFRTKSINDSVVDNIIKEKKERKKVIVIDTFITVQNNSFAIGKQIRDILWPANLFVLSFKPSEKRTAELDEHGGRELHEGDVLHIRYSTFNEKETKRDLIAIVGEQNYNEEQTNTI